MATLFTTDRMSFRHLRMDGLDDLARLYADPEIREFYPEGTLDRDETREELEWFLNGHPHHPSLGLWATLLGDRFIGRCGLLPWELDGKFEVEVAYLIDKDLWGQGLGTEAATGVLRYATETLGLKRLICLVEKRNTASIRVAEKIGMRFERAGEDDKGPYLMYSIEV